MSFYNGINTLTGDCSNTGSGGFTVYPSLLSEFYSPYTLTWFYPTGATYSSQTFTTSALTINGLTAGTYSFRITESFYGNFNDYSLIISSSNTITLSTYSSTTCGQNNGIAVLDAPDTVFFNNFYLYNQDGFFTSANTSSQSFAFNSLSPGIYYCEAIDYGGCSGTSNTIFIGSSTNLNFGLYVVDSPACSVDNGQIYVTGLTGTLPYTYYWGEGIYTSGTTSFQTGLTAGGYVVEITDAFGCSTNQSAQVNNAVGLNVLNYTVNSPSCMTNDGSVTVNLSGGSAPFYYLLSNGESQILLSNQVTFTGLSAGDYTLNVTDVGLCTASLKFTLSTPSTFTVISTSSVDASCNTLGSINVNVQGGSPPYKFLLSSPSGSTIQNSFINSTTFSGLIPNNYTLTINDVTSACTFVDYITINNNTHFDILVSSTGATCSNNNGIINVSISNEYLTGLTWTYLLSNGENSLPTSDTYYNFTGLSSGSYTVTVQDNLSCIKQEILTLTRTNPYSFFLYPTSCLDGSAGTITAIIPEEDGPFNLIWSENTNGQDGYYITGLTAGTYTLTLSGDNNCLTTLSTNIQCTPQSATSYSFKYTSGVKSTQSTSKLNLKNMMYQGYTQVSSSGDTCSLNSCTFYMKVNIGGTEYQFPFYYTTSFNNIPEFSEFTTVLQNAILAIPHIQSCTIDPIKNTVNIVAESDGTTEYYKGESVEFIVILDFSVRCGSINNVPC